MDNYCAPDDGDVPYWYGERALTGLLVAAAWRLPDGWGLEEFTTYRGRGPRRSAGRGDAWLGDGNTWGSIECKCQWPRQWPTSATETRRLLEEAKRQLATLDPEYRGAWSLAVCYIVPDVPARGPRSAPAAARSMLVAIADQFRRRESLVAVYRPPRAESPRHAGRCYPGVVFVAEEPRHQ